MQEKFRLSLPGTSLTSWIFLDETAILLLTEDGGWLVLPEETEGRAR